MVKEELIRRSPLRLLERSIHGGLKDGEIGVFAARKGTGKTACLVHIATDQLLQDRHVIHVSFAGRTDHIVSWYEDIFGEIAKRRDLEHAMDVHDSAIRNRMIMNFSQEGITVHQFLRSIRALIDDGQFRADVLVVDGYDFSKGDPETLRALRDFAKENGLAVWFSASVHRDDKRVDERGVPMALSPFVDSIDVLITLTPEKDHVGLRLLKDHGDYSAEDLHLELDSRTLLIREDK
ncbi:RecA-superfamily ATPase, KaiC/GvpD/RAD55 family [Alkalispirochaeta americana]|uniref:RecA-superfamily ATPase, KaiC/GvpD/RAD55 family n=1 Tax=Alkalispirochaeta americana TaxID=159291 RepID=A0A1N6TXE3_9SPIO|nr:AAA family ATPase [Alkalispirochaeta americana]SIQ58002.1 RecA-superfamily ATPase, KaiC/GvpD/RAD55 family [Alkalispirochaeta americana]